jgi:Fe-S oxidoreductase
MPKVGLFIPCYVDQLYPQVGLATLRVLRQLGLDIEFPEDQTCCGQPMDNSGCAEDAPAACSEVSEGLRHTELCEYLVDIAGVTKRIGMAMLAFVLEKPWLHRLAGRLMRWIVPLLPRVVIYEPWNV